MPRVADDEKEPYVLNAGEYGRWKGVMYCRPPDSEVIGNLSGHTVVEHEDGTITVTPSILINQGRPNEWHGYLEQGVWRKC